MQFIDSDLGHRERGDVVEVTLTSGANVRLLDQSNFQKYKRGERHQYNGGLARRSPVRLQIPRSGHWHAVVDMQGLRGSTRAGFRVVPAQALLPLPPLRERTPIRALADNLAEAGVLHDETRDYDVFISHASEDKAPVVRPLAHALRSLGLSVWYDEFELRIGDSLRRRIDQGIACSRFGVVVLSPSFFAKQWPQYELDGLVTLSLNGKQVLLPLWHELDLEDVMSFSPSLADKVAVRTRELSIDEIARQIADVVHPSSDDVA